MATNFRVKIGEIGRIIFIRSFVALAFRNGWEYGNSNFKRFNAEYPTISSKHLVNFGSVTSDFKRGKYVYPLWISNLTFSRRRHC